MICELADYERALPEVRTTEQALSTALFGDRPAGATVASSGGCWTGVPDRAFYRSIGAQAMEKWTVHRVTGDALRALAGRPSSPPEESVGSP